MTQETMLQYIVRKLNDGAFKQNVVADRANLNKSTVNEIALGKNKDPSASTVQKLYDVFKSLAD